MEEFLTLLQSTGLFSGISVPDLRELLRWLHPVKKSYRAGELLLLAGYEEREIGIILRGELSAERTTAAGEALPFAALCPGSVFGDVLSGSHSVSPVTIAAKTDCLILFVPHARLLAVGADAPAALPRLLQNLIAQISDKYFALGRRLDLLMTPRLRQRVLLFLAQQGAKVDCPLPLSMNRTALAQYLGCERTALARELSRMQAEGLLLLNKNTITIKKCHLEEGGNSGFD